MQSSHGRWPTSSRAHPATKSDETARANGRCMSTDRRTRKEVGGVIIESPRGVTIEHSLHLNFPTSNNQARIRGLDSGLLQAKENEATRVKVFTELPACGGSDREKTQEPTFYQNWQALSGGCHRTVVQQNLEDPVCMMAISVESIWKKPIEDYLERGLIPDDAMEAKMLIRDAAKYTMVEDQLSEKDYILPC
ncbi:hypothetical protein K1719_018354 [Acacia pycnantha]|nr:hypothetical protein K1719_018354 [Acacia pycnantha]